GWDTRRTGGPLWGRTGEARRTGLRSHNQYYGKTRHSQPLSQELTEERLLTTSQLFVALLVAVGHHTVEQTHAPSPGPALVDLVARRIHGVAGDVEMRPRGVLAEALDELRRGNGAGVPSAADVLHVGVLAVDLLVVGLVERHAPNPFARDLAGGNDLAC